MNNVRPLQQGALEPYWVEVPDELATRIDRLVEQRQRRTGEDAQTARRNVKDEVLERGLERLEREIAR